MKTIKAIRNLILYTITVIIISVGCTIKVMNEINSKEIETTENETTIEYLTTQCNFTENEIVCE